MLLDGLLHLGSHSLFADHRLHGFLAIFAILLGGNCVSKIHFLNIFLRGSGSIFLGFMGLDRGGDLGLDLHEDDLLAVGRETVVLLAEAEEGGAVGLLHLREVGCLVVTFMGGGFVDADDHPALEANSGLQRTPGAWMIRRSLKRAIWALNWGVSTFTIGQDDF